MEGMETAEMAVLVIIEMAAAVTTMTVAEGTAKTVVRTEMAAAVTTMMVAERTAKTVVRTEMAVAVYQRGHWFVSGISEVRIMWNITMFFVCTFVSSCF
jgi:hypothetical protein